MSAPTTPTIARAVLLRLLFLLAAAALLSGLRVAPAAASPEAFGIESFANPLLSSAESPLVQAGSHPYALKTHIVFNHEVEEELAEGGEPGGRIPNAVKIYKDPKDVTVDLPAGLIANPTATLARCTEAQLQAVPPSCSTLSEVGVVIGYVDGFPYRVENPIYNMVPPAGKAAEFGSNLAGLGFVIHIVGKVRSDGDYGLTAEVNNILHSHAIYATDVTIFGAAAEDPTPLLTMPTSCSGRSLLSTVEVASWPEPTETRTGAVAASAGPLVGCAGVGFAPKIEARPDRSATSSPTGLHFKLAIPQEGGGTATSEARRAEVTLPEGMTVNPASANGLGACTPAQIGLRPAPDQVQTIAIDRPRASSFTLSFEGNSTASLPADSSSQALEEALDALPGLAPGELHVTELSGGWAVEFEGSRAAQEVAEIGGTVAQSAVQRVTVPNFNNATFNLSLGGQSTAAEATGELTSGSTEVAFTGASGIFLGEAPGRFAGEAIAGEGIPAGTTILKVQGSTLTLSTAATETKGGVALSASLPGNAPDSLIQAALEALPAIGAGNLSVSGGFENGLLGARKPYVLTFIGALANPATVPTLEVSEPGVIKPAAKVSSQPPATEPLAVATTRKAGGAPHFSAGAPSCPNASKLGTVEVKTPLLDHPLPGSVYLASQEANPFHSLVAIYIVVNDPASGVVVKLAGEVKLDPASGRLTTIVDENPQLPFEELKLDIFGGATAPLATPAGCGEYKTESLLEPWSHHPAAGEAEGTPDATPSASFTIDEGCTAPALKPAFTAGTLNNQAGSYSPLVLHLAREDGSPQLRSIETTLPPGLTGKLAGVGECSDAQIAAAAARSNPGEGALEQSSPSCPASSEVGRVTVGAGVGPSPFYVSGRAYLAGPYKGAPLSLAIITPAVAGPFDLGTVVVQDGPLRQPRDRPDHREVRSDPDHPGRHPARRPLGRPARRPPRFTLNPTNCSPLAFSGQLAALGGATAPLSSPFEAANCAKLSFKPKLSLKLKGGTKRNQNPALTATVTYPKGGNYANIASAQVTLPHSAFLDQAHIGTVCTRVQFAAHACPAGSVYGKAIAYTPLLDQPLSGPVYLRSSSNKLPDLVADLNGQIEVALDGKVDTGKGGGIRNTFSVVPDAPVSKFVLSLEGGKQGLLVNSENLCSPHAKTHAIADFTGQNGKIYNTTPKVQNSCPKKKGGKGKGHHHHKSHRLGTSHR